jgi:hypothetical protein
MDRSSNVRDDVPDSFKRLKALFRWQDGWRSTFPDTRDYTCWQHRKDENSGMTISSYARLYRTCVDSHKFHEFRDWAIKLCPVQTDHRLILTQIACRPETRPGQGRWNMPHQENQNACAVLCSTVQYYAVLCSTMQQPVAVMYL